jgi:hypothetical protein
MTFLYPSWLKSAIFKLKMFKPWMPKLAGAFVIAIAIASTVAAAFAQSRELHLPDRVEVGTPFSVPTPGSGNANLYVVSPEGALRRDVQRGESVSFAADDIHNAGRYAAFLVGGGATHSAQFDADPSPKAATLSFLAKPSRLPVGVSDGISGVVYVFDVFGNLVLQPQNVSFEITNASGQTQSRVATTRYGVAWLKMNSATKVGLAKFAASAGTVRQTRIVQQVAGDPCTLRMTAKPQDHKVLLETAPVLDCTHNPVPDGTIVTFTELYGGQQATVDVPIKRGVARTELPEEPNAVISVAAGVVMGNEIHLGAARSAGQGDSQ